MEKFVERAFLILKFQVLTRLLLARKRFYSLLKRRLEREKVMVNIGGGLFFRPHWKVMDYISPYYPFAQRYIDYNVDLCNEPRFPFPDNSVSFFYSAHTLEHIPQEHCANVLREIYRCLKPGGAVRLTMPDYDLMREAVATGKKSYFAKLIDRGHTMEEAVVEQIATAVLDEADPAEIRENYHTMSAQEFADHYTSRASREQHKEQGGYHINWFTYEKLSAMLKAAGFATVYRSRPQGSRFMDLTGEGGSLTTGNLFEIKRMLGIDTTHPDKSLFVEAVK